MNEDHAAHTQATAVQRRQTVEFSPSSLPTRRSTTNTDRASRPPTRSSQLSGPRSIMRTLSNLAVPDRPVGAPPSLFQGIKAIILGSCEFIATVTSSSTYRTPYLRVECPAIVHSRIGAFHCGGSPLSFSLFNAVGVPFRTAEERPQRYPDLRLSVFYCPPVLTHADHRSVSFLAIIPLAKVTRIPFITLAPL